MQHIVVGETQVSAEHGVVVVSQTCDVVRLFDRPNLIVAKAVPLDDADAAAAERGRTPRYVPVPGAPTRLFADLEYLAAVEKTAIVDVPRERCIADEDYDGQRR